MGNFSKRHNGKVVGSDSSDRPGWKGPGYVKKAEPKPKKLKEEPETVEPEVPQHVLPVELQQLLLNIFKDAFPDLIVSNDLKPTLQEVKQALYERDFARAFGKQEYLEAYSVRWSPSRALCYASILVELRQHLNGIPLQRTQQETGKDPVESSETTGATLPVVSLGGGAAETIAFGALSRYTQLASNLPDTPTDIAEGAEGLAQDFGGLSIRDIWKTIDLILLDNAAWGDVVSRLQKGLISLPVLSKYANASTREANRSLLTEGDLATTFQCQDVLGLSPSQLKKLVGTSPMLITILFTLNELYTASIAKTTALLLNLTAAVSQGTLLLVVDSPGSYSETTIGKEAKKYPMHFLLDHTLIGKSKAKGGENAPPTWEKIISEDSKWFRRPKEIKYLIELEDMRYQLHLYRRL
ncbi:hypothetical protein BP6252_03131 [Coleophoma cylindrospora]|uniref:25S rRNA (Uridine(2843)-N(3))-methyltransferase n=1 Tax=Coleophoma cylindrospora TaxID=1849047 RepID=A0A3D8S6V1_9HELO|nr:hypothetical protein BP6252_03131 [Coleophoma cylindrospora]